MSSQHETRELEVLLSIHGSVATEIGRRHGDRYKLQAASLILLGIIGSLLGTDPGFVPGAAKAWILSLGPFAFSAIFASMLKEHQYIGMRDRYLENELRPRIEAIASDSGKFSWMSWEEFEHKQMGRQSGFQNARERFLVFALLGVSDYAIPSLLVLASLTGYLTNRQSICSDLWLSDIVCSIGVVVFLFLALLMLRLRFVEQQWFPERTKLRQ